METFDFSLFDFTTEYVGKGNVWCGSGEHRWFTGRTCLVTVEDFGVL